MPSRNPPQTYRDLTPGQKRSGLAAWLGWMFDGLDMPGPAIGEALGGA